jgi:hypothetical protein
MEITESLNHSQVASQGTGAVNVCNADTAKYHLHLQPLESGWLRHLWLVWHPLHKEGRAVVAIRILECRIQDGVNVPLNGWKLRQDASASVTVCFLQLSNDILLGQKVNCAVMLPMRAW